MLVEKHIASIRSFLENTKEDRIEVRTSYVSGSWYDVEFAANRAGFSVYRDFNKKYESQHTFAEVYIFVRK